MKRIKNIFVILLILTLAFLWLKELSEKRARQATDRFLGPTLEQYEWQSNWFWPLYIDSSDKLRWLGWQISYVYRFGFIDSMDTFEVDWFGRIRKTNNELFYEWLALPEDERIEKQAEWSAIERQQKK